jgi:hypothetical protein
MAILKELKQRGFIGFRLLNHVGLSLTVVVKRANDFAYEIVDIKRILYIP